MSEEAQGSAEDTLDSELVEVPQPEPSVKSTEQIAMEVLAGWWGRGNARKKKLQDAGYDYAVVKAAVQKITRGT